jgi:hypothetical protein
MLEREDIERLREIFVTRQECDNSMEEVNRKLANDSTRLAVIETKLGQILWLCGAIGGGIITMLIKMFFGG